MTAILKVDTIQDTAGNNIINESSDTITIGASGDTTNIVGTLQNNGSGLISGITEADQWRVSATQNYTGTSTFLTANWERNDTSYDKIGTGMTETSGVFSFPSTGIYNISYVILIYNVSNNNYAGVIAHATNNNSTYYDIASSYGGGGTSGRYTTVYNNFIFDVTNTSNDKIKLKAHMQYTAQILGAGNEVSTGITFIRLGDT